MIKNNKKSMYITVFAAFLAFMGMGVVDPILPVIAKQIGAKHWEVEMLFSAYIFTMAFIMIPAGMASNRFGEKKVMVVGLFVVAISAMLCAFSNTIPQLSIFRSIWGLGNAMFFATAITLLISMAPDVSAGVGAFETAIGLGLATGPLVGGFLGQINWRYPFATTSILVFIAFLLAAFFIQQPKQLHRKSHGLSELVELIQYMPFLTVALSAMLYFFGFFTVLAYSPLLLNLSAIELGYVFFGWGLMLAYGSAKLAHQLESQIQPKIALTASLLAFALILLAIFLVDHHIIRLLLIILSGLVCGLTNALFTTYIMEISPYERGITSSAYNLVRWLGAGIAPIASGLISEHVGATYPYLISCSLVVIGLLPFIKGTTSVVLADEEV